MTTLSPNDKPVIIIRGSSARRDELDDLKKHFEVHYAASPQEYDDLIDRLADSAKAVVTNGSIGLKTDQMEKLKQLRIVLCRGVGFENVDVLQAKSRGIVITNGAGANWFTVADQAMTLLFGIVRDVITADHACRANDWSGGRARFRPSLHAKRIGVVGAGMIGRGIMRRASGFEMEVYYTSRTQKADLIGNFIPSVLDLALHVDYLVLCLPGGPETRHIVNADVLEALGPSGYLVNVARGSVVDTAALIDALNAGTIAGGGLDVWEGEPEVPQALINAPRLLLSPHIGGLSPEAVNASTDLIRRNLHAFFAGRPREVVNRLC